MKGRGLSLISAVAIGLVSFLIAAPVTVGILNYHRGQLAKRLFEIPDDGLPSKDQALTVPSREETVEKLYKNMAKSKVDVSQSFFLGDKNAPVRIVEFSDFRCPACREKTKFLRKLLKIFPKGIVLYYKNFPLDRACMPDLGSEGHEHSCLAAKTGHCVGQQGKFWSFHDQVFDHQESVSPKFLKDLSQKLQLNEKSIEACVSGLGQERVQKDIAEGRALGVDSTPTFWVNDRKIDQSFTLDKFYTLIALLLKQETGLASYPSWEESEFEIVGSFYE
jgi:protein-disulfide isomerase